MRYLLLLVVLLNVGRCVFNPDAGTFGRIAVTNARDDGDGHYYAVPAACATIHWNLPGLDNIYVSDPNGQVLGPFAASGELRTIPLHSGMVYTVYPGGRPGEVSGISLVFDTPASPEYPGNQANGYVDPSCV